MNVGFRWEEEIVWLEWRTKDWEDAALIVGEAGQGKGPAYDHAKGVLSSRG